MAEPKPPVSSASDATVVSANAAATVVAQPAVGGNASESGLSNPSIGVGAHSHNQSHSNPSISISANAAIGAAPSRRTPLLAIGLGSLTGLVVFGLTAALLLRGR